MNFRTLFYHAALIKKLDYSVVFVSEQLAGNPKKKKMRIISSYQLGKFVQNFNMMKQNTVRT